MRAHATLALPLALVLATTACTSDSGGDAPPSASVEPALDAFPACEDVPPVPLPEERFAASPVYVGNEQPTAELEAWARDQPGYAGLWIDRDHNGWVVLAFTEGAAERHEAVREAFPDVGVAAVEVTHGEVALRRVQDQLVTGLQDLGILTLGTDVTRDVVEASFEARTPARMRGLVDLVGADAPVCVSGPASDEVVTPPPQASDGDGWHLLAAEFGAGTSFRTDVATTPDQLATLWQAAGVAGEVPEVDLRSQVVVWFAEAASGSCRDLRLRDVGVVDDPAGIPVIHAKTEVVTPGGICTDDANPFAFVVAVDREILPRGPFALQLQADVEQARRTGARTEVEVDLSAAGSTVTADQLRRGDQVAPPEPRGVGSGDVIETGFPTEGRLNLHCGLPWPVFNDITWQPQAELPPAWEPDATDEEIAVELLLEPGDPPTLTATAQGATVRFLPATEDPPGCD